MDYVITCLHGPIKHDIQIFSDLWNWKVRSLRNSNVIWRHRSGSGSGFMPHGTKVPSHYLNSCLVTFIWKQFNYPWQKFKNCWFKHPATSIRDQSCQGVKRLDHILTAATPRCVMFIVIICTNSTRYHGLLHIYSLTRHFFFLSLMVELMVFLHHAWEKRWGTRYNELLHEM